MTRRARAWLAGVLMGFALAAVVVTVRQGSGGVRIADFTLFYAAATLVRQGDPAAVYDLARTGPEVLSLSNGMMDPRIPFSYPLATAVLVVPLTVLPLQVAFRVWQVIIALTLLGAIWLLHRTLPLGRGWNGLRWALLAMPAAIPTWGVLVEGQFSALPLLGAAAVVRAVASDRPGWGFWGGTLLALKPQYLPAYLVVLWASRCRRSLLAALLGAGLVTLSPGLVGGPAGMAAMIHSLAYGGNLTAHPDMDNWAGMLAVALPPRPATIAGLGLFAVTLIGLVVLAARRRIDPFAFAAFAGCLAVLGSPHTFLHDLVLLLVPAWVAFELHRQGRLRSPVVGLAIIQAALVVDLHGLPVSAGALAISGVLGWYVVDFRRRAAQRSPLAQVA